MQLLPYDRQKAADYAKTWAYRRNPRYFNFDGIGGDCTNFVSQCIYAGCGVMNDTKDTGWYYRSPTDRAAAWSGVDYLYRFLTRSRDTPGPVAHNTGLDGILTGDVIQLQNAQGLWYHTLFVCEPGPNPLVAAHTMDVYRRPLSSYSYHAARFLHLEGAWS